jgi:PKD repeat protein
MQQSIISIDPNNPCVITLPSSGSGVTQTACNGTLYDVGGPNGNYYDNNNSWITIAPQGSSQITLNFTSFDIEAPSSSTNCNWDYIEIFDGADTSANSLGQYCNTLTGSPGTLFSSGGALTVYLHADAGVNGTGFEANWTCVFPTTPPSTNFVLSDTVSCNTTINFTDLSSNGPSAWLWDFGDGSTSNVQNPTHTYFNSGSYTIKLTATNQYGSDSLILINHLSIIDLNLQTTGAASCGSGSLTLNALVSNGTVNWYADAATTNLLATGTSFVTPVLSSSTTYYAQSIYDFPILNGGPIDNNFGVGSYFQGDRHLIFDNYKSSTLKSVLVYAGSDGYRTIELRNSSNAVLSDTIVYIPFSPNGFRINLNFSLPVQNNMQLGISDPNSDLFRTSSGAVFPYTINDVVAITGTTASAGYYYFFYDWEVQASPCISVVSTVDAIINSNSTSNQSISICNGDSISVGGNYYTVTGNYSDTFTTNLGCDSIIITQLSVVQGTVYTQQVSICEGLSLQVGNNSYSASGIYIDTISLNGCDSIITTNLSVIPSVVIVNNQTICQGGTYVIGNNNYSAPGSYFDNLTTPLGCDSTINTNLTVVPNIDAEIVWSATQLVSNVLGGFSPYFYLWSTGEITSSITPLTSGTFWLLVTDAYNCTSDTVYFLVDDVNAIHENETITGISIFPNPTEGLVVINFKSIENGNFTISILNVLGVVVFEDKLINFSGFYQKKINLDNFAKSVYLIRIETSASTINKKLILR